VTSSACKLIPKAGQLDDDLNRLGVYRSAKPLVNRGVLTDLGQLRGGRGPSSKKRIPGARRRLDQFYWGKNRYEGPRKKGRTDPELNGAWSAVAPSFRFAARDAPSRWQK